MNEMTDPEMQAFAARHGLTWATPEHLARIRMLAAKVVQTGTSIARMPDKADEPAGVFRLPLASRG